MSARSQLLLCFSFNPEIPSTASSIRGTRRQRRVGQGQRRTSFIDYLFMGFERGSHAGGKENTRPWLRLESCWFQNGHKPKRQEQISLDQRSEQRSSSPCSWESNLHGQLVLRARCVLKRKNSLTLQRQTGLFYLVPPGRHTFEHVEPPESCRLPRLGSTHSAAGEAALNLCSSEEASHASNFAQLQHSHSMT